MHFHLRSAWYKAKSPVDRLGLGLAIAMLVSTPVMAGRHTPQECREGADFIRNAALSRDNGLPREMFLERLHADLFVIRAMPVGLRWFARDQADESLLIQHAERVYAQPVRPGAHEEAFVVECDKNVDD